jgi:hypothetical protein
VLWQKPQLEIPMATKSKATAKRAAPKTALKTAKKINGGKSNKSARVVAMMRSAKGVTRNEILKVTGWKAVSPAAVAATSGFKIKIDNSERPYRYSIKGG